MNFGPLFREHKFLTADISHTSCERVTKFSTIRGLANGHWLPEFGELWAGRGSHDTMQQFTDALVIVHDCYYYYNNM